MQCNISSIHHTSTQLLINASVFTDCNAQNNSPYRLHYNTDSLLHLPKAGPMSSCQSNIPFHFGRRPNQRRKLCGWSVTKNIKITYNNWQRAVI